MIAALMATNALAIDTMLPALPAIGAALHIPQANQQQWIVTAYLLGFGAAQLLYGTISDRFGRKPVLLVGLGIYALSSLASAFAPTFTILLISRVMQGISAAAPRVIATAMVRDCYGGRQMARVLSLAFIVFLAVPIAAPSLGQLIMLVGPWPWVFAALAVFAVLVLFWALLRLPETLHPEDRMPIAFDRIAEALRLILTNRMAVGYTLAMTLMFGALFGFLNSAQQVFANVFRAPALFSPIFGLIAFSMAISSILNARIVVKVGMRRVAHKALIGFVACTLAHLSVVLAGIETMWTFASIQFATMFCFGLVSANFAAISMEPLAHVAGTASSVQGFVTTLVGATLGFLVGQQFSGTVVPLILGFAGFSTGALVIVFITEKGRLFRPST
jgi:DHA1 family bicyclomycin/chloramphenicol resistance-like MFS transporter